GRAFGAAQRDAEARSSLLRCPPKWSRGFADCSAVRAAAGKFRSGGRFLSSQLVAGIGRDSAGCGGGFAAGIAKRRRPRRALAPIFASCRRGGPPATIG